MAWGWTALDDSAADNGKPMLIARNSLETMSDYQWAETATETWTAPPADRAGALFPSSRIFDRQPDYRTKATAVTASAWTFLMQWSASSPAPAP